jgi:uncharacterized repeat protein (TIGR03803 family)
MATLIAPQAHGETLTVLYAFQSGTDGDTPTGDLILDESGNLYGTTKYGGSLGYGTVFRLDPGGKESVLHSFTDSDGAYPYAGLVRDAAGNLYGTTFQGGPGYGGTVFKLDPEGRMTALHNFAGSDGYHPYGVLIRDRAGNLYGTTGYGGTDDSGVVFKLDEVGKETLLYQFHGSTDGANPIAGVVRDREGNFFGTTSAGGRGACEGGCGTVFMLRKSGEETTMYRFLGSPDGAFPFAGVIRGQSGNFYGTTFDGGRPGCIDNGPGCGTVFKVNVSGREDVLYRFQEAKGEGLPDGGLVLDPAGNLYGTTLGTVFRIDTHGKRTILHHFSGGEDGGFLLGGLLLDAAGNLYGTAGGGGAYGHGVVFKIVP